VPLLPTDLALTIGPLAATPFIACPRGGRLRAANGAGATEETALPPGERKLGSTLLPFRPPTPTDKHEYNYNSHAGGRGARHSRLDVDRMKQEMRHAVYLRNTI